MTYTPKLNKYQPRPSEPSNSRTNPKATPHHSTFKKLALHAITLSTNIPPLQNKSSRGEKKTEGPDRALGYGREQRPKTRCGGPKNGAGDGVLVGLSHFGGPPEANPTNTLRFVCCWGGSCKTFKQTHLRKMVAILLPRLMAHTIFVKFWRLYSI